MTRETLVTRSPREVIELAKRHFTSGESGYSGTVVDDGDGFVRFRTFRGSLAISAWAEGDRTRVRCSTLRYHPSIGQFLSMLETRPSNREA